ncbi:TPA: hypothetical protein OOF39_000013 [Kluyvera ascorbata]|nr:hypothetical protein [Kluyvera ascorbata]
MTYRIETRNYYLRYALEVLSPHEQNRQDTCIIDLSSYKSLQAILHCVRHHNDVARFIFIGNDGALSRALQSLISVESSEPLIRFHEKICHCPGVSYDAAMDLLLEHQSMDGYSHRDKTTVYSLLQRESMQQAAQLIGISNRMLYQRVERLTKKLNLRNGLQAHHFFRYEYHPDFVRAKINEHVRITILRQLKN